jgi:hypothetical protein
LPRTNHGACVAALPQDGRAQGELGIKIDVPDVRSVPA